MDSSPQQQSPAQSLATRRIESAPHSQTARTAAPTAAKQSLESYELKLRSMPFWAQRHVLHWIRNPDEGSAFERTTRYIRCIPDTALLTLMSFFKYGGVLFHAPSQLIEKKVSAHVFFQIHGTCAHIFSVHVDSHLRGQGLGADITKRTIEQLRTRPELKGVRFGAGKNEAAKSIHAHLVKEAAALKLSPQNNYFFDFI